MSIEYTKATIRAFQKGYKYIASFDLTACYDSINHNLLQNILKEKVSFSDNCAKSFTDLIEQWESADGRELGTGIPQGPQASGIVAEAVLQEYDAYIESLQKTMQFVYYRYVDDIRILAPDEDTVKWVLFLLDKKSKELGLFPQSSKISTHEITDIDKEIKRISKPLFEDEFDDEKKSQIATEAIRKLLKEDPADLTSIRRYFQCVTQNSRTNKLAVAAVKKYPNLIHSFAYYVQRYPRVIPPSISNYIYQCCMDKTLQFSAGILLESVRGKLNAVDVKTERFYLYDIRNNAGLQLYDQYVNEWIHVPSEPENSTNIQFIQRHSAGKNIIYFNKPTDIEKFANEMLASLPDIALSPELSTAIEHISEYINSEYTIVKCLKKGIIYHHGSVPDTVRSYIEYLYNNFPEIKYVITSSTLLEGVNIPATKLFIMDNRKGVGNLSPSAFKNLIGRICRFGEIFDKDSGSLSYLEPEIYFVFDKFYAKNSNVKKYVSDVMKADKDINDQVDNVLLKNSVITEENTNELIRAEEFIENYEPETIQNYQQRYAATNIGKICILNNVTEIDVFDCEAGLDKKVSEYAQNVLLNGKISDSGTLLDAICDIFLPYTRENEENNNFLRFRNISAKNYYKMFLSWKLQSLPFNQMISHTITYWRRIISQNGDPIVYVGKWGTQTRDGGHRNLWTDIREKDQAQLINLAIVRVKEEQDFIDNTIMKFVEVLHDLELIEQNLYLTLKYGTANAVEIVLIKNGVSTAS